MKYLIFDSNGRYRCRREYPAGQELRGVFLFKGISVRAYRPDQKLPGNTKIVIKSDPQSLPYNVIIDPWDHGLDDPTDGAC